jgi:hypothetical protein
MLNEGKIKIWKSWFDEEWKGVIQYPSELYLCSSRPWSYLLFYVIPAASPANFRMF